MKNDQIIKFDYINITKEDIDIENKHFIENIKEDSKEDFQFEGLDLYHKSEGHSYLYGFYDSYITKNGIIVTIYYSGICEVSSNGLFDEYTYKFDFSNNVFTKNEKEKKSNEDCNLIRYTVSYN